MLDKTFMILGGGGMVGFQVARTICRNLEPEKVVIASLYQQEVREAVTSLEKSFPEVTIIGAYGDVFVRSAFNENNRQSRLRRADLLNDSERRDELYDDLYGDLPGAFERSQLVQLILTHKPDVIVDAINTATAISYQDIYSATKIARRDIGNFFEAMASGTTGGELDDLQEVMLQSMESLIISQYIPQLVRHVVLINKAMRAVKTRLYLKIGTTGTGGMGLNIPYTHGEDKPSAKLMSKSAIGFAHTGLLFLMARTQGGPIVKEIKPAALIGWVDIAVRSIHRRGKQAFVFQNQAETIGHRLQLRRDENDFTKKGKLKMVVADTGENGLFTKGEFESITALGQMEFLTPEEIARAAVLEIQGINTGKDVITALDSAVMGATYRAGYLRRKAIEDLNKLEEETGLPSVGLGELGPPEISKLLWEAYLLKAQYETLNNVLELSTDEVEHAPSRGLHKPPERSPEDVSAALHQLVNTNPDIQNLITSVGIPILLPDGKTILRGPFIRIPEVTGQTDVEVTEGAVDRWANKGWVDLRPANMARWQARFHQMRRAQQRLRGKGSAAVNREAYLFEEIFIGEVVGWVFNNELGGFRIK